jgi:hypothetical protein
VAASLLEFCANPLLDEPTSESLVFASKPDALELDEQPAAIAAAPLSAAAVTRKKGNRVLRGKRDLRKLGRVQMKGTPAWRPRKLDSRCVPGADTGRLGAK